MAVNVSEELARLAQLRDQGVLSEAEFAAQKAALLSGNQPAAPASPKAGKNIGKGCLIVAAVVVILIIIGAIVGGGGKSASEPANQAVSQKPVEVTARHLAQAYAANEAAAQQQYGNSPLLVSGTVSAVSLDFSDNPVVELQTDDQFLSAHANLTEASKPKASGLSKGQQVKLLCGSVTEVVSMPMLKDCDIQ